MSTPTEAHRKLWIELFNLAHREILEDELSDGPATHLIAESEARAVAVEVTMLTCMNHNDQHRSACPVCLVATLTAERDQLRAEVVLDEELQAATEKSLKTAIGRAEKAEAELATEREKLNWVFTNCEVTGDDYWIHDREDLAAAMKEGAK